MDDMTNQGAVPRMDDRRRSWDNASFVTIGAALFLLPTFFIPSVSFPFQMGKVYIAVIAAVLSAVFWIVASLRSGSLSLPRHPLFLAGGGVLVTLFLSTLFSIGFSVSLLGVSAELQTFGFLAAMIVLFGVVSLVARSRDRIFYLYLALFASFLVVSLYHLIRLIGGTDTLSFGIFTSAISNTVGKWNDLGILFGLGALLSLVTLELASLKPLLRNILYAVLVFSLFFLTLVNFISVWVAVGIFSILLFVYMTILSRVEGGEQRKWPVLPLVVFAISLIFVIPIGRDDVSNQMRYVGSTVNDSLSTFFNIVHLEVRPTWGATFDVAKSALRADPVFGAGLNHFTERWLLSKPTEVNRTAFWNTDFTYGIGLIPTIMLTTGLLGVVAWILFLGVFVWSGFRAILSLPRETDRFGRYLIVSSYIGALFLWLFLFIYVPSATPVVLAFILTGVFIGSLVAEGVVKTYDVSFIERPRAGFAFVLGLVFLLILSAVTAFVYTGKIRAAMAFQKAVYTYNVVGNPDEAEVLFRKAAAGQDVDTYYRFLSELTLIKINTLLRQNTDAVNLEVAQQQLLQLFGEAKQFAETARDIAPSNYQNWLALGRVYEALVPLRVEGAYEEAVKAYTEARFRNPQSPEVYLTEARLEVANGDNESARELIRRSLAVKPNYTEAVFFLSQIEVAEGNISEAISSVEASIFLSPQEPVLYFQLGYLKFNTRDYRGAIEALEQAVAFNQNYANARYFLGLSYDQLGRTEDAINQFEIIRSSNPDNQEVIGILENLRAGRPAVQTVSGAATKPTLPVSDEPGAEDELIDTIVE